MNPQDVFGKDYSLFCKANLYLNICIMRQNSPSATLQEIGNAFGLTRERIRQILKQNHLSTKATRPSPYRFNCLNCGIKSKRRFCSKKCYSEHSRESVYCEVCNTEVRRLKSRIKYNIFKLNYKHTFCSKRCQGIHLGNNYGFSIHPEHRKNA